MNLLELYFDCREETDEKSHMEVDGFRLSMFIIIRFLVMASSVCFISRL